MRARQARGSDDPYYDLFEDFDLIVSSFLSQYGFRIYSDDFRKMKWEEFRALLSGLGPDTPLGRMVQIRSEEDEEILKYFTPEQKRIRREWRLRKAEEMPKEELDAVLESLKQAFVQMAGGDTH